MRGAGGRLSAGPSIRPIDLGRGGGELQVEAPQRSCCAARCRPCHLPKSEEDSPGSRQAKAGIVANACARPFTPCGSCSHTARQQMSIRKSRNPSKFHMACPVDCPPCPLLEHR